MKQVNEIFSRLNLGNIVAYPYIVIDDDCLKKPQYAVSLNEKSSRLSLSTQYADIFRDVLYFQYNDDEIICSRYFENISSKDIEIKELGFNIEGICFGKDSRDDYFYHVQNPRRKEQMTFRISESIIDDDSVKEEFDSIGGTSWNEKVVDARIGTGGCQPFPAILISNYNTNLGLVHGSLSQKVFFHNYSIKNNNNAIEFQIYSSFKNIKRMSVAPGKVLIDEWYIGTTDKADDVEKIFKKYTDVLRKKLPVGYGRTDMNRDNMVWGSWNDGIRRSVTEDLVLREANYLKENFPTVHWIQLDDGYSKYAAANGIAHGIGVPYEGEDGVDEEKFPFGLRNYADKIREIGLRPAIWIGLSCPTGSKIYLEHPEWFFDFSDIMKGKAPMDVSVDEAREYLASALNVLCRQNGYEGVKLDFWSYSFEDSNHYLKNDCKSGYEYREWWMKEVRSAIPNDGYFQTGCAIVMGNPFLGEYFTNYRYGIDVNEGKWENIKKNYMWGMACFALHTGDMFVPNSDAVGMFLGLGDDEAYFLTNYCLVTHSMVEIAGVLSRTEHNERYRMLKKAVCNPNNGQDIFFADYNYRKPGYNVPEIVYFKTPHFSTVEESENMPVRTVGIFNLSEEKKTYILDAQKLGLNPDEYVLTDVWNGKNYVLNGEIGFEVRPHASMLLAVSRKDGMQLYDANIRINSVRADGNTLLLETDYKLKEVELTLSCEVKKISLNGKRLNFEKAGNKILFDAHEKGELRIETV